MNDVFYMIGEVVVWLINMINRIAQLFQRKNKGIVKCKNCGEQVAHNWIDGNRCFYCQHDDENYKYTRP